MRVAAIDCGTNSLRLLVADAAPDGGLAEVIRRMEIVRLGEGVDQTGRLADAALERTRRVMVDYAAEIARLGVDKVRMCATSASRDAANAADFTTMVKDILGVDPEVVSGNEEARLSFTGAARGLTAPGPYLVVDIGGGSTEFVVGTETVDAAISVDIGCVRMTERHIHSDPPSSTDLAAARADITATVDRALAAVGGGRSWPSFGTGNSAGGSGATGRGRTPSGVTLVGLAGSVTTIAAMALGLREYDRERVHHAVIGYEQVARVAAELADADHAGRLAIPVMHPGRADVIIAGAMILRTIMERSGETEVIASESDILDGIAWSLT